ncbi:elongin A, like [Myripristis murdjan]|uniref:elongin A, like n=1 Tax=Myripristis murdjan TaxID=586833 RepID=UPI001176347D|nr:elongin-A-like [Myripristis murdjan]
MASSSDVVKKVVRFQRQLSDATESATVLKILQKLKDLDITLDILAETGIGKSVNSLRRHEQVGESAKSLVRYWKKLVPKESTSHTEDGDVSQGIHLKDNLDDHNHQNNGSLTIDKSNGKCLTSLGKSEETSPELFLKIENAKTISDEQQVEKEKAQGDLYKNRQPENQNILEKDLKKKIKDHCEKDDNTVASKKKKNNPCKRKSDDSDSALGNTNSEDTQKEQRPESRQKSKSNSDTGNSSPQKESNKKPTLSSKSTLKEAEEISPTESSGKRRQPAEKNQAGLKYNQQSDNEGRPDPKNKKAKKNHKEKLCENDQEEPSMSFESYLNYDLNLSKRKERSGPKNPPKKMKTHETEAPAGEPDTKSLKSSMRSRNVPSPKKVKRPIMDMLNIPLPAVLPECDKSSNVEYFVKGKVCLSDEKIPDFCEIPEESVGFTGQRLNRKMQVYSGAKTACLPAMLTLYQQCIRTLQNNIDLIYETGGVPFEILQPVLERCTPDQLLRIEECNPIYIGATDHLWGKHCQRDFRDSKLLEYESWKEMYIRLSEEREKKLQRLTKSITSAQSRRPQGRQVKMAFIHTVAKPPRDVRIQQEIHGTAVQIPHQLRCSVKFQDNRTRPSGNEQLKSSAASSGTSNTQDPRKKTSELRQKGVAPMMAKSLKAFKKQFGRR